MSDSSTVMLDRTDEVKYKGSFTYGKLIKQIEAKTIQSLLK